MSSLDIQIKSSFLVKSLKNSICPCAFKHTHCEGSINYQCQNTTRYKHMTTYYKS